MPHATPPLGITAPSTTTGARTVHAITVFFDTTDHFSLKLVELDGDEKRPLCPTQGKNKQEQTKDGRRQRERDDWAREYWGQELVEIVEDDGENNTRGRPEPRAPLPPQRGVEGRPEPRARVQPPPLPEAELRGENTESREPRRRFTSPSSLDQDD